MGKPKVAPPPPSVYRDNPIMDDAASTSSAVLLDDIDGFPEEELPAYTDEPVASVTSMSPLCSDRLWPARHVSPTELPWSKHDASYSEFSSNMPNASTDADVLQYHIASQARYPPGYYVEIRGTHNETKRQGNKETKDRVTDFYIRISIQYLIARKLGDGQLWCLPNNVRGYRGGRIPTLEPTVATEEEMTDVENPVDQLKLWCEAYVQNPGSVKSFTMKRQVIHHNTARLEKYIRSAISETRYRGHVSVKFATTHDRVIFYSPGKINDWRLNNYIRWFFYLTFLWVISWPVLFFLTRKYEVVTVNFPYADKLEDTAEERRFTRMSELDWYNLWSSSIKRAALARMKCEDRSLDEAYRQATADADARGLAASASPAPLPNTGNSFADAALGVLGQGLRVAEAWSGNPNGEWGFDR
ncbi:ABC transporter protein [Rutstroemia sp. NJR-2017a BBW]|nr:ABC transporter protein [Rutstroemia sp. NJR-2017a BBW]